MGQKLGGEDRVKILSTKSSFKSSFYKNSFRKSDKPEKIIEKPCYNILLLGSGGAGKTTIYLKIKKFLKKDYEIQKSKVYYDYLFTAYYLIQILKNQGIINDTDSSVNYIEDFMKNVIQFSSNKIDQNLGATKEEIKKVIDPIPALKQIVKFYKNYQPKDIALALELFKKESNYFEQAE